MRSALLWLLALDFVSSQLVVNVRNKGGEIYKETIEANATHDTVTLDFKLTDGTLVTQFIDARNVRHIRFFVLLFNVFTFVADIGISILLLYGNSNHNGFVYILGDWADA